MSTIARIFLTYAARDAEYRSLLVGAARAARLPVQFVELPGHITDVRGRQALCRAMLQRCDAAVVLLSPHALAAPVVDCDVRCLHDTGVPLHAIQAGGGKAILRPPEGWDVQSTLGWNWGRIASWLQRLHGSADRLLAAG